MSAELMKSKFVRRPSSVRPSVRPSICGIDYLWTLCTDFFQILVVASPGPYAQTFFSFKKKKNWFIYEYFSFLLTWDPMGAKISKRYSSYKSQPKVFKLFLNFLPNGPHKTSFGIFEILSSDFYQFFFEICFWDFWNLNIEILTNFILYVNMRPSGSENYKPLLLLQGAFKWFWNLSWIPPPSNGSHKTTFGIFEILSFSFFFRSFFSKIANSKL